MINGTKIEHRSGSEGPRHDPYHYDEWKVTRSNGSVVKLHLGLGMWISIKDRKFEGSYTEHSEQKIVEEFERLAGCSLKHVEQAYYRYKSTCRTCERITPTHSESGYPGESLNICDVCGTIVSADFDESAII